MKKKRLSSSQSICIILLWLALCYIVLTSAQRIDGPTVVTLLMSAALVFIPVIKAWKQRKE
ncbi:MAG: hypothetical protein SOW01_02055 [Mediterranea sp.]|nr:hypothetical protein [Mediterranea sp.]